MSFFKVLSEIEKSSDRTETRKFSHEIWSSDSSEEKCIGEEFQNEFQNIQEEYNQNEDDLTFQNEIRHDPTKTTFSNKSVPGDFADNVKTTIPKRVDKPTSLSHFESLQESSQNENNNGLTKTTVSNNFGSVDIKNKENATVPSAKKVKTPISSKNQNRQKYSDTELGPHDFDCDATDYFDSEDEYFENYIHNFEDDRRFHDVVFSSSITSERTGRYSQGVSQYYNMPIFRRSLQTFAKANGFTVHDVMADGNCLFRAIDDQLSVNGIFGNSPDSLRKYTLMFLRENPYQEDGSHMESFLFTESWEQYLSRMEQNTEWCDHVILKAAVEALGLRAVVFNVYGDDIRRTEVPSTNHSDSNIAVYLGHFGEFHYLSLRPKNWDKDWQRKALMFRYQMCSNEMNPSSSKIQPRTPESNEKNSPEMKPDDHFCADTQIDDRYTVSKDVGYSFCPTYGLKNLDMEQNEESLLNLVEDPFYVDTRTGLPLPHLTYLIRHLIPVHMILTHSVRLPPVNINGKSFEYIGSYATGTNVYLRDITRRHSLRETVADMIAKGATVVAHDLKSQMSAISIDTEETHPGFLRLRVLAPTQKFSERSLYRHEGKVFLKRLDVPEEMPMPEKSERCYMGFISAELPEAAGEWLNRQRKYKWPPKSVVTAVKKTGCSIIPKHHPKSSNPEIEWKFNFSTSEVLIFARAVTDMQLVGFFVLKILIEHCTYQTGFRLKNKHIKAVFCNCCEQIPVEAWETNFSGCVLYSIAYLIACLKSKNLPNYFIQSNNLLHDYTEEAIEGILVQMEALRLFPVQTLQFLAEKYGYTYGASLSGFVLRDCRRFASTRDVTSSYHEVFVPGTIRTAKFLTRQGYYEASFALLRDTYEINLFSTAFDSSDSNCSLAEFFCTALGDIRQEASRIILAKMFENECGINILDSIMKTKGLLVADVLPWKVNFKIASLQIPIEKTLNFELLGEFFFELSKIELKRFNCDLASLGISEAILCFERAIQDGIMIDVDIEDESLRKEVQSQMSLNIRNLKEKLRDCYIHTFSVSQMHLTFAPMENYMPAIEELCKEFPEIAEIVSQMFRFLRSPRKQKEYAELFDVYLGAGTKYKEPSKFMSNKY